MNARNTLTGLVLGLVLLAAPGCGCGDDGPGPTSQIGTFEGLHDDMATGFNFPLDIGIVPGSSEAGEGALAGDILVASYGTSEIMLVSDPSAGPTTGEAFYDGTEAGLAGATAVSIPPDGNVWAAFEQGGEGDAGGLVVLSPAGERLALIDGAVDAAAFDHPGGLCFGLATPEGEASMFMVNLGDGTAWRVDVSDGAGSDPVFTRIGSGLATGTTGNPGTPGSGITSSGDLPEGGARGCAFHEDSLYVADTQNARVVRFDGAAAGEDLELHVLADSAAELVTYPTGLSVNDEGVLIVISYDNAHAFVAVGIPEGSFIDNGLYDLNVNSGNHGVAVAHDTVWFSRANNSNGALRAITPEQDILPATDGPFPPQ